MFTVHMKQPECWTAGFAKKHPHLQPVIKWLRKGGRYPTMTSADDAELARPRPLQSPSHLETTNGAIRLARCGCSTLARFQARGALPMKSRSFVPALLVAGLFCLAAASNASAFELLNRMLGGGYGGGGGTCGCEPTCGAPEPSCCVPAPSCCAPKCCQPRCHKPLFSGLCCRSKCCEPACCDSAPKCGCEPSCAAPVAKCGCEPSCCAPKCHQPRCRKPLFSGLCCRPKCCEPACGCDNACGAEPSCGCGIGIGK